jgi:hypothetical protein
MKQKNAKTTLATLPPGFSRESHLAAIRDLLAREQTKEALEAAKLLFKQDPSPEAEALLIQAYLGRLRALAGRGLEVEARELGKMVEQRFPAARPQVQEALRAQGLVRTSLTEILRPLRDPALPPEKKGLIEEHIRRQVWDLRELAACTALPPEHPYRRGAATLESALEQVTRRPMAGGEISLPEISHRSPLAPWKILVRALACFYAREDEECHRALEAIPEDSVPAKLKPVLCALLEGSSPEDLPEPARSLAEQIGGLSWQLEQAFRQVDRLAEDTSPQEAGRAFRRAHDVCRQAAPELLPRLEGFLMAKMVLRDANLKRFPWLVESAGPSTPAGLRLTARALEQHHPLEKKCRSIFYWEAFRQAALGQGWFEESSPENAAIHFHMAQCLLLFSPGALQKFRSAILQDAKSSGFYSPLHHSPAEMSRFFLPSSHLQKAALQDPHEEVFRAWLEWTRQHGAKGEALRVAEVWHDRLPGDTQPLLFLMEEAEERGALKTALDCARMAEASGSLDPSVRRARLRLLTGSGLRHLSQRKAHLVEEDLRQIAQIPPGQEKEAESVRMGLSWALEVLRQGDSFAARIPAEWKHPMGGPFSAWLWLSCFAQRLLPQSPSPSLPSLSGLKAELPALLDTALLAESLNLKLPIPFSWIPPLEEVLLQPEEAWSEAGLLALARQAMRSRQSQLGYAVTIAGMKRDPSYLPHFLLLRGLSVRPRRPRASNCFRAAAELARRQRNPALLQEAVESYRNMYKGSSRWRGMGGFANWEDFNLSPSLLSQILEEEQRFSQLADLDAMPQTGFSERECLCPSCRRARGDADTPAPPDWDEEEEDEEDGGQDSPLPIPPEEEEQLRQFLKAAAHGKVSRRDLKKLASAMGMSLEEILLLIEFGNIEVDLDDDQDPPEPAPRKRITRPEPEGQGSLF